MTYTEQKELDTLYLSERWACRFMNFINAGEYALHEKATKDQIALICWAAFSRRLADMCNYVDHESRAKQPADVKDWDDPEDDKEWHYWVNKQMELLMVVSEVLNVVIDPGRFRTGIMLTQYNTKHYVLITSAGQIINPDPTLKGRIIEQKPLVY